MKTFVRKLWRAMVLGFGASLLLASTAMAAALTYNADTVVALTSPAVNLVILSGSVATTVTVNDGTLVAVLPAGATFTVTSASTKVTVSSAGGFATATISCDSSQVDTAVVTTAGTGDTVTITPTSVQCPASSGSGGGGGGGGGSYTPAPTSTPSTAPIFGLSVAAAHADGTLVLDGTTVYLIKDGKRLGFRNSDEYKSHGYNFGQAVAANAQDKALPQAEFVQKALEGTLVLDASDGKTVYMIGVNGTKRGFASAAAFKALGYAFVNLPKINLSDYPAGQPITSGSETHPEGALVRESNGTVWWILGVKRQGFESLAVFNTYGFPTSRLVKANANDLALPQGPLVKFRDGTLVLDGGNYYLVSDGKKIIFASAADLTAKGYKTSNAIPASLSAY
jgi:hypothetical protein